MMQSIGNPVIQPTPQEPTPPVIDPLWMMSMLHDLGSPLRMVNRLVKALSKPETPPQLREYAERALPAFVYQANTRLDSLWDVLKATTEPSAPELLPLLNLADQVYIGIGLLRPYIHDYLEARETLALPTISVGALDAIVPVRAPAAMLHRMIENVVFNSVEAGATQINLSVTTLLGEAVLVVHDDGPGFPEVMLARITPGFTTKADGRGIGLAAVAANAHRLGGSVELKNLGGAVVVITLPLITDFFE